MQNQRRTFAPLRSSTGGSLCVFRGVRLDRPGARGNAGSPCSPPVRRRSGRTPHVLLPQTLARASMSLPAGFPPVHGGKGDDELEHTTTRARDDLQSTWSEILVELQLCVPKPSYDTWLQGTSCGGFDGSTLIVSTPNAFVSETLERRMGAVIHEAAKQVLGSLSMCGLSHGLDRTQARSMSIRPPARYLPTIWQNSVGSGKR